MKAQRIAASLRHLLSEINMCTGLLPPPGQPTASSRGPDFPMALGTVNRHDALEV